MSSLAGSTAADESTARQVAPRVIFCYDDKAAVSLRCGAALESVGGEFTVRRYVPPEFVDTPGAVAVLVGRPLVEVVTATDQSGLAVVSVCLFNVTSPSPESSSLCCEVFDFLYKNGMKSCLLASLLGRIPSAWGKLYKPSVPTAFCASFGAPEPPPFVAGPQVSTIDVAKHMPQTFQDPLLCLASQILSVQRVSAKYIFIDSKLTGAPGYVSLNARNLKKRDMNNANACRHCATLIAHLFSVVGSDSRMAINWDGYDSLRANRGRFLKTGSGRDSGMASAMYM